MFLGRYEHTIDAKGRLTIPARFRDPLVDGAYLTQGFDTNLIVFTPDTFENMYNHVGEMSITDPSARQLNRLIFGNAVLLEMDRTGRFLIPQFLRDFAQLDHGAVVIGVGKCIEIWSPSVWEQQNKDLQEATDKADRFSGLRLTI